MRAGLADLQSWLRRYLHVEEDFRVLERSIVGSMCGLAREFWDGHLGFLGDGVRLMRALEIAVEEEDGRMFSGLLVSKPVVMEVFVGSFEPAFGDWLTSLHRPVVCNFSCYRALHRETGDMYTYTYTDTVTSCYARQSEERVDVVSIEP